MGSLKKGATVCVLALVTCAILAPASSAGPTLDLEEALLGGCSYPQVHIDNSKVQARVDRYDSNLVGNKVDITGDYCAGWKYQVILYYGHGSSVIYPQTALPRGGFSHTFTQPCRGKNVYWGEVIVSKPGMYSVRDESNHVWLNCTKPSALVAIG